MTNETPPNVASRTRLDWIFILLAIALFLALGLRAAVSIDPSLEAWWQHLPWAARLGGLMPADGYTWNAFLEQRFAGFPLMIEWLQGQLWRLTGRAETTNLVALGSLALFVLLLRVRFKVPMQLALLGLVAIPLVQVSATGTSADLPANLALAGAFLMLMPLYSGRTLPRLHDAALFFLLCALAAHARLELLPVVAAVFALGFLGLTWTRLRRGKEGSRRIVRVLGIWIFSALAAAVIFFIPAKNLSLLGDPLYPFGLKAGEIAYSGPQDAYELRADGLARVPAGSESAPVQTPPIDPAAPPATRLAALAEPFRARAEVWANQVLDVGAAPLFGDASWARFGAQQFPLAVSAKGFLGWYALFNLGLFALLILTGLLRRLGILVLFALATALAIAVPDYTALNQYMFWMLLLVSLNLVMLRPGGERKPASASTGLQRLFALAALAALAIGIYATRADLIRPTFQTAADLAAAKRNPALLAQVQANPTSCLVGVKPDEVFVYAPLFNAEKTYRLKMGPLAGEPQDQTATLCGPDWTPVVATP